ncbi:helix-turn-helix domain-containing protein [Clostridium butyricum]
MNTYEFRIYVYLMSLYNKEKGCSFPSQETIADKLSIGLTTVKKSIKKLNNLGYIKIEKQKKKIGHYNKYSNFKHLIGEKKELEEKRQLIVSDYKESGIQIYIDEVVDNKVNILSIEERKQKDIDNNISVRLARKYTDIDSSKFDKELISNLDESLVREGCSSFKDKLELGKLKENCASNLLKECIDTYLKQGVDLPTEVFNKYKKIDNLIVQPSNLLILRKNNKCYNI